MIAGERYQQMCDVYLGYDEDFQWNPVIRSQKHKFVYININEPFDNPKLVFCYSHRFRELSEIIHFFQNPFTLVSHNSDGEIRWNDTTRKILECEKLEKWYGQNLCIEHEKLHFLPIGIANSQWSHGITMFEQAFEPEQEKSNNVYFNFNIGTNSSKRLPCYESLKSKLQWLPYVSPTENVKRLKTYKFCICPEGNGVDTHRLWEALYLKVIPIVIDSEFTQTLLKNDIPLIVLNSWDDFDESTLVYNWRDPILPRITRPKICFCIYGCVTKEKYRDQILKINETWGKDVDKFYFLGEERVEEFQGEQYVYLDGILDDYMSASYKQELGLKYIYEKYNPDFVHVIGTDTFVNIPNLLSFIKDFDPNDNLYIGGHGCNRMLDKNYYFHSGGPGFILSRKCLELLVPYFGNMTNEWIDLCEKTKQEMKAACDVSISYFCHKINSNIVMAPSKTFLHCNYKGFPCHINQINPKNIISCHLMSLEDFDDYYSYIKSFKFLE